MPYRVIWKNNMEKELKNFHYVIFKNWLERESNDFLLLSFFNMNAYISSLIYLFQSSKQNFL